MPDPIIHSSSWTGPLDDQAAAQNIRLQNSAFPVQSAPGTDITTLTPAVRVWARLVAALLFSPLLLWAGWQIAHLGRDVLWADHREWLFYWTCGVALVFARECYAGRPADPKRR